jgi:hypothetical protein
LATTFSDSEEVTPRKLRLRGVASEWNQGNGRRKVKIQALGKRVKSRIQSFKQRILGRP